LRQAVYKEMSEWSGDR